MSVEILERKMGYLKDLLDGFEGKGSFDYLIHTSMLEALEEICLILAKGRAEP